MSIAREADIDALKACAVVTLGACVFGLGRYYEATQRESPQSVQGAAHTNDASLYLNDVVPQAHPSRDSTLVPNYKELESLVLPPR